MAEMASQKELAAALARITLLEEAQEAAASGIDTGDTAFILVCSCLVLMMTIPGLALFYGAFCRRGRSCRCCLTPVTPDTCTDTCRPGGLSGFRNVLSTVMQSFAITCEISVLWLMFGYSLAFGSVKGGTGDFIGGGEKFWFRGDDKTGKPITPASTSGTIPEALFCMFQLTFAIITCAIIAGSFAERMKFNAMLIFMALWHLLIYCPIAHWEWVCLSECCTKDMLCPCMRQVDVC